MRPMLLAAVSAAGFSLVAIGAAPAQAQGYASREYPICLHWRDDLVSCRYTSMAQCNASASGIGATCLYNPAYPFGPGGVAGPSRAGTYYDDMPARHPRRKPHHRHHHHRSSHR